MPSVTSSASAMPEAIIIWRRAAADAASACLTASSP